MRESMRSSFRAALVTARNCRPKPLTLPCFWHKNFGGIVRVSPQPNFLEPRFDINVPRKDAPMKVRRGGVCVIGFLLSLIASSSGCHRKVYAELEPIDPIDRRSNLPMVG